MTRSLRRLSLLSAAVAAALAWPPAAVVAQTVFTWNNTGTDWNTASDWTPNGIPGTLDIAQFNVLGTFMSAATNPVLNTAATIAELSFSNAADGTGYTLSGTGSLTAGSATVSGLVARGTGTYTLNLGDGTATSATLTGATGATLAGAINVGNASTVALTGNTVATLGASAISLRGGRLLLDNSAGNPVNQRLTGTGQINLAGGGSVIEFRSASAGSTFNGLSGAVSLGAGDAKVNVKQTGAGALAITFGSLARTNTSATINFANIGSGTLGGGGAADPSVKFTTAPFLTNGVIANTAGGTALGFAIYNSTDFAGYDATNGVVAVASTPVSGALATAATQNSNLNDNATIAAAATVQYNSLKISPSAAGQSLAIGTGGTLNTAVFLLTGANDYTFTGGTIGGGTATHYYYVTNPNTTFSISTNLAGGGAPFNKAGDGFMALTGTSNQVGFAGTQRINLTGGTLRVTSTNFDLTNATTAPSLLFRGGVIEYDVSAAPVNFAQSLGTAAGNVNWALANTGATVTNTGSGGFSAVSTTAGNTLTVNLGGAGATLTWGGATGTDVQFVQDGYALKFGSAKSNATVVWQNNIDLGGSATAGFYSVREVFVALGSGTAADRTRFTGTILGTNPNTDLQKTGPGVLELAAPAGNTYAGNTLVQAGTLMVSNTSGSATGSGLVRLSGNLFFPGGATLRGGGSVSGSVIISNGAVISPGDGVGRITVGGSTLLPGGNYNFELNSIVSPVAGTNNDLIFNSAGTLNLSSLSSSGKFNVNVLPLIPTPGAPAAAVSYTIASFGTIAGFDTSGGNTNGLNQFRINDPGNFIVPGSTSVSVAGGNLVLRFTPVPEPATVLLACAAGAGVAGCVRRRRSAVSFNRGGPGRR